MQLLSNALAIHKIRTAKKALQEVSLRLAGQEVAMVRLQPEPENKFDSKVIAFQTFISDKWHWIGYIALDDVHSALDKNAITNVEFAWARF